MIGEASTSWSFVGAGLRLSAELLGPEYSMAWNSLDSGLKLFFSRDVRGKAGEDLVEKQNAEMGLMPVVANEAAAYGYEAEDRHFVRVFLGKEAAEAHFRRRSRCCENAHDGVSERRAGEDARVPAAGIWRSSCQRWRRESGRRGDQGCGQTVKSRRIVRVNRPRMACTTESSSNNWVVVRSSSCSWG